MDSFLHSMLDFCAMGLVHTAREPQPIKKQVGLTGSE